MERRIRNLSVGKARKASNPVHSVSGTVRVMFQGLKTWNALGKGDPINHKILSLVRPVDGLKLVNTFISN